MFLVQQCERLRKHPLVRRCLLDGELKYLGYCGSVRGSKVPVWLRRGLERLSTISLRCLWVSERSAQGLEMVN